VLCCGGSVGSMLSVRSRAASGGLLSGMAKLGVNGLASLLRAVVCVGRPSAGGRRSVGSSARAAGECRPLPKAGLPASARAFVAFAANLGLKGLWAAVAAQTLRAIQIQKGSGVARRCLREVWLTTSNPSIERTASSRLRRLKAAAHVER
jgi:hypothetical protein